MLHTRRTTARWAGLATAAGLTMTLAGPASPAAAVNDWGTLDRIDGSRLQACKLPVGDGQAWRIELRVKTGEGRAKGSLVVVRGGERTDRRWRSGWVAPHDTSGVGAVRIPRGNPRWRFLTGVETDEAGVSSYGAGAPAVGRC